MKIDIQNNRSEQKKIGFYNYVMILCMVTCILLMGYGMASGAYNYMGLSQCRFAMEGNTEKAALLREGTDNLTRQARNYVSTFDVNYINYYFAEVDSKRREDAVVELMSADDSDNLKKAKELSDRLMERELRAIKLGLMASGNTTFDDKREEIRAFVLPAEDVNLSKSAMKTKAYELICGADYALEKADINAYIEAYVHEMTAKNILFIDKYRRGIVTGAFLACFGYMCMIIVSIIFYIFFRANVSVPLTNLVESIKLGKHANESAGIEEIKLLSRTYNRQASEVLESRSKELGYHQALLADAMLVYELNVSSAMVESVVIEDENKYFTKNMKRNNMSLPCSLADFIKSSIDTVADEDKDIYARINVDKLLVQYASGKKALSREIVHIIDGRRILIRTLILFRTDEATKDIKALVVCKEVPSTSEGRL